MDNEVRSVSRAELLVVLEDTSEQIDEFRDVLDRYCAERHIPFNKTDASIRDMFRLAQVIKKATP
jgi:hypothetical protein